MVLVVTNAHVRRFLIALGALLIATGMMLGNGGHVGVGLSIAGVGVPVLLLGLHFRGEDDAMFVRLVI